MGGGEESDCLHAHTYERTHAHYSLPSPQDLYGDKNDDDLRFLPMSTIVCGSERILFLDCNLDILVSRGRNVGLYCMIS